MKTFRLFLAVVCGASLTGNIANAFSIRSVTLSPGDVVPPGTALQMIVDIVTPSQGTWLYAPTVVSSNSNGIHVDVYPTSGMLTAIGAIRETVDLGTPPPGLYRYEVVIHPNFTVNWGTRTNQGIFVVQGENDPAGRPVVSLELVDPQAMETLIFQNNIDWAEFRVLRTGPATQELTVFLNTQQGSARLGEDYSLDGVNNGSTVRFPAGAHSVTVRLYPIDDDFYEGDENVFFHLIAPPPGTPLPGQYEIEFARSSVAMVIHDNDPVATRLDITSPRNGQQFQPGDVIELRAQIIGPGSSNSWSVEFLDGNQRIGTTQPGAPIWWTDVSAGQHIITARATNPQGASLASAPVTIQVGPGAALPVVSIGAAPFQTGEPCPTCFVAPSVITIRRTSPTNTPLTVYLAIDGTATPGTDYQTLPTAVEIPAGQHLVQVNLLARDDQLVEGPEVVRVRVLPQPPPLLPPTYFVNVYAKEALMVIFDDEPGSPAARLDIIAPTNDARLRFPSTVELSALAVNKDNEVYGPVEFYAGGQFIARSLVTATTRPAIPGLPSVHTAYWTNPPIGQHTLTARTQLSFNNWITSPPVNVTVESPTFPVVRLETWPATNAQAREFCPPNADCAYPSFIVRRTGPTIADLRVYLSYSGTATPDADYPLLPESVVIAAGLDAAYLTLVPKDDSLVEGPETVIARFTPVPGPGYIQDPNHASATITIIDNDVPQPTVVSIRAEDSQATELPPLVDATDPAQFRISRTGDLSRDLLVFFSFGGSAAPGQDYQHRNSPVTIPAGESSVTLEVLPIYDELKEGMETVLVRLEPSLVLGPLPTYQIDSQARFAVAGIFDGSGDRAPDIEIVSPGEGDHFRLPTSIDIIVAAYHPTRDIGGIDFYADNERIGQLLIAPEWETADTVFVHRFTWSQPREGTPTLTARGFDELQNSFGTSAPVRITVEGDQSRNVVRIDTVSPIAEESSDPLARPTLSGAFRISRTGPTSSALPVFVTYSGTATPGHDYQTLPFIVTIPQGTNATYLGVHAIWDQMPEGIETVVATISNCPPPPLGIPCYDFGIDPAHESATVFIRDDGLTVASVAITRPTNGASFHAGAPILIEAVAIDLDGYISHVEFFDGNQRIGVSEVVFIQPPPPGTPIHHEFEWRGAASGAHTLTARAARPDGSMIVSEPVRITVGEGGNQPPAIAITRPANGTEFPANASIDIVAATRDPDGYVHTVEFFADGRKIGERHLVFILPPPPGQTQTFTFLWREPAPGVHVLTARAIDDEGGTALSPPVEIRIGTGPLPVVTVVATDCFAVEPSSNSVLNTASFRLQRFGPTNSALTVRYALRGTAQNGVDYDMLSGSAIIPAGNSSVSVIIRPVADNLREGMENVILQIEEHPDYLRGRRHRAVAVIADTLMAIASNGARWTRLPDRGLHLCFSAQSGHEFRIEASGDLRDWDTVFTTMSVDDVLHFVEDDTATFPLRFYRIVPEP